jgi:hypothetical protein
LWPGCDLLFGAEWLSTRLLSQTLRTQTLVGLLDIVEVLAGNTVNSAGFGGVLKVFPRFQETQLLPDKLLLTGFHCP